MCDSVGSSSLYKHLVPVLLPLAQIGLTGSIYLTMAIAVERYTTVCHPFFKVRTNNNSTKAGNKRIFSKKAKLVFG